MKLAQSLIIAALIAAPVVSFAQSSVPVTRAQVRAELVQLEKAGYNESGDQTQYPKNLEAAEARVGAQNNLAATSYGGVPDGTSGSGAAKAKASEDTPGLGPIYAHP